MRIDIDDKLLAEINKIRGDKCLSVMIEEGLRLLIKLKNQNEVFELWGKIEFDDETY